MIRYVSKKINFFDRPYRFFLIFFCSILLLPCFINVDSFFNVPPFLMRLWGGLLCIAFLIISHWPKKFKKDLALYIYFAFAYSVLFITTIGVLNAQDREIWLLTLVVLVILLLMLVGWQALVILTILGSGLGALVYVLSFTLLGGAALPITFYVENNYFLSLYFGGFALLIGSLFLYQKKKLYHAQGCIKKLVEGMVAYEMHSALQHMKPNIQDSFPSFLAETKPSPLVKICKTATQQDIAQAKDRGVYACKDCVVEALANYNLASYQRASLQLDLVPDFRVRTSFFFLTHLLLNLIENVYLHGGVHSRLQIKLENRKLYCRDNGKGVGVDVLPYLFSDQEQSLGKGLFFCQQVMEAFGGSISCNTQQGEGAYTEFVLQFPPLLQLVKVR